MNGRTRTRRTAGAALAACVLAVAIAAPAAAHDPSVSIQAEHGAVFDPLYPMETGPGIWSRLPDAWTRMASTTKVMTAEVVLELADDTLIDLDDLVTISANASLTGGSALKDVEGVKIRIGERIKLRDLLYGLMIPSGNNAAVAIAEHVGWRLYNDADEDRFAYLMNLRADELGLDDSVFTNASGFANSDLTGHHTTARDLARLWSHAMAHPLFREIVRPRTDAYVFYGTTATGAETKYSLGRAPGYLGDEGSKNGKLNGCGIGGTNDDTAECFVMSARRLGRRLVAAGMQSVGTASAGEGDPKEMLDLGFARLFHPEYRLASATAGAAYRHALACPTSGRAMSAVLQTTGRTRLVSWSTNVGTKAYSRVGTGVAPTGLLAEASSSRDVDVVALTSTRAVTATRVGTNTELRLWSVPSSGAPTTIGSAIGTRTTGVASSMELVRINDTLFASVAISSAGDLAIKTWRRTSTGIQRLAAYTTTAFATPITEIDVARSPVDLQPRFVVLATRAEGAAKAWSVHVDPTTGLIKLVGVQDQPRVSGASITAVPTELDGQFLAPVRYAMVGKVSGGLWAWDVGVAQNGSFLTGEFRANAGGSYHSVAAAGFGTSGLLAAVRMNDGTLKLIVWEVRPKADGRSDMLRIASHQTTLAGTEIELCRTGSTASEGDFITAAREGSTSALRIRGWRIAPRPLVIPGGG
jgi:D-alanyl-D-alanine carboxypeptidase